MQILDGYQWPPCVDPALARLFTDTIDDYLGVKNVTCIDIGFVAQPVLPFTARDLAVRVHFRDKPSAKYRAQNTSAARQSPTRIGVVGSYVPRGVSAAVVKSLLLNPRGTNLSNVQPGIAISNNVSMEGSGTLGLVVKKKDDSARTPYMLSCWHILGNTRARTAKVYRSIPGDSQAIAHLESSFVNPSGDMGLARLLAPSSAVCRRQLGGGTVRSVRAPALGDAVTKSGAASLVTCGTIDGIGVYLYRKPKDAQPVLVECFRVVLDGKTRIASPGDSGAVWYDGVNEIGVGLHFAGTPIERRECENFAIAAHLDRVMAHLDVEVW